MKRSRKKLLLILTDSLSCLQALKQITLLDYRIIYLKLNISMFTENVKNIFSWIPSHIGIEGIETADSLTKEARNLPIDSRKSSKLPYSEFRPKIKKHIFTYWDSEWKTESQKKLNLPPV